MVGSPYGDEQRPAGGHGRSGRSPGGAGQGDLIEIGGNLTLWPWRGARGPTIGITLAALIVGLLAGFTAGHLTASSKARPVRTATRTVVTAPPSGAPQLIYTGNRCAVQQGRTLQLGIEILNQSGSTITVNRIRSILPLGGLRQIGSQTATCGAVPVPGGVPVSTIANGASAWLTATFAVRARCPAPYPVLFVIGYARSGRASSVYFDGFPDLGSVRYTGCGASS